MVVGSLGLGLWLGLWGYAFMSMEFGARGVGPSGIFWIGGVYTNKRIILGIKMVLWYQH